MSSPSLTTLQQELNQARLKLSILKQENRLLRALQPDRPKLYLFGTEPTDMTALYNAYEQGDRFEVQFGQRGHDRFTLLLYVDGFEPRRAGHWAVRYSTRLGGQGCQITIRYGPTGFGLNDSLSIQLSAA